MNLVLVVTGTVFVVCSYLLFRYVGRHL